MTDIGCSVGDSGEYDCEYVIGYVHRQVVAGMVVVGS